MASLARARPMASSGPGGLISAAILLLFGCAEPDSLTRLCRDPIIDLSSVAGIPGNELGAIVTVQSRFSDSIGIRYRLAGDSTGHLTPAIAAAAAPVRAPVLGLLPEQEYRLEALAFGECGRVTGAELQFTTGSLPDDLPAYLAGGPDPSPGFVVFGAGLYGLAIDNTGRVVWYHRFLPSGPGLNFQPQPNGHYVARPPPSPSGLPVPFQEISPLGEVTRTLGCARGLQPRFHDLILEPAGSYWVMCDEVRTVDLSDVGGVPDARVTGTTVQHVASDGSLLFEWNPFDHFALTDLAAAERGGPTVNWTHGNAIDLDPDGNLLVSFRSLDQITKIDTRTGAVLWRMGGRANQFDFRDTPMPPFTAQHGVRAMGSKELMLLDNLGDPAGSRAERYEYDEATRTVRLLRDYPPATKTVAQQGGTTQVLRNGRTLVSYGNGARVEEYDAAGAVVWRIQGNTGYVFRAQRIQSLYHPGVGEPR